MPYESYLMISCRPMFLNYFCACWAYADAGCSPLVLIKLFKDVKKNLFQKFVPNITPFSQMNLNIFVSSIGQKNQVMSEDRSEF